MIRSHMVVFHVEQQLLLFMFHVEHPSSVMNGYLGVVPHRVV